jgi:hypothetical protein
MSDRKKVELTQPERSTVLTLLYERLEEGSYYGNRRQYIARVWRIIRKLEES